MRPPPNGKTASKVHFRVIGGGIFFQNTDNCKTQPVLRMNLFQLYFDWAFALLYAQVQAELRYKIELYNNNKNPL